MTSYSERIQRENIQYFARLRGGYGPCLSRCGACGGERVVALTCERCQGTGEHECSCPSCGDDHTAQCPDCDGQGKVDASCPSCGGSGYCEGWTVRLALDRRTLPIFRDDELRGAG